MSAEHRNSRPPSGVEVTKGSFLEQMALFDRLPKTLRATLNDAPYKIDAKSTMTMWRLAGVKETQRAIDTIMRKALVVAEAERPT